MTDERDPNVSQRYRDLPGEEPLRELDQAILAAAHRAADKPHAPLLVPAGRHRWYFSLGAAAILVLAVAVTMQVERQQPDPELTAPPAPAQAPAPAAQPAPTTAAKPASKVSPERLERRRAYTPDPPAQAPASPAPAAPAPEPMAAPQTNASGAMADSAAARADENRPAEARKKTEQAAGQRSASDLRKEQAAPQPSVAAQSAAASPERELERIAELRRQGRDEEADKAFTEFRKRYPDYRIPQAMLEKVERKAPAR